MVWRTAYVKTGLSVHSSPSHFPSLFFSGTANVQRIGKMVKTNRKERTQSLPALTDQAKNA